MLLAAIVHGVIGALVLAHGAVLPEDIEQARHDEAHRRDAGHHDADDGDRAQALRRGQQTLDQAHAAAAVQPRASRRARGHDAAVVVVQDGYVLGGGDEDRLRGDSVQAQAGLGAEGGEGGEVVRMGDGEVVQAVIEDTLVEGPLRRREGRVRRVVDGEHRVRRRDVLDDGDEAEIGRDVRRVGRVEVAAQRRCVQRVAGGAQARVDGAVGRALKARVVGGDGARRAHKRHSCRKHGNEVARHSFRARE